MNFRFSRALPPGCLSLTPALMRGIPFRLDARRPPICLLGNSCVLGAAVERVGNALYGARVYLELGRRLAHAHAARQRRPDTLSQLVRDRRPAKALTFTLGPP